MVQKKYILVIVVTAVVLGLIITTISLARENSSLKARLEEISAEVEAQKNINARLQVENAQLKELITQVQAQQIGADEQSQQQDCTGSS